MTPADKLLDHFDRLAGSEARLVRISDEGQSPAMHAALYSGFPQHNTLTGFTLGLSHFHPEGGAHKELTISMRDDDESWVHACGFVAHQLREHCLFACGDTINFRAQIANSSDMSAFIVVHPSHIPPHDTIVDIGVRQIEVVQLLPIYEQELNWLNEGGEPQLFLDAFSETEFMDPKRKPFGRP